MKPTRGYRSLVCFVLLLEFCLADIALEGEQPISVWCDETVLNLIVSKLNEINAKVELLDIKLANANANDKTSTNIDQLVADSIKEHHAQVTQDAVSKTLNEMRDIQLEQQLSIAAQFAAMNRTLLEEIKNLANAQRTQIEELTPSQNSTEMATKVEIQNLTNLLNRNQQQINRLEMQIEQGFENLKKTNYEQLQSSNRTCETKNEADGKQIIALLNENNDKMKTVAIQVTQGFEGSKQQLNSLQTSKIELQNKITNVDKGINAIEAKISPFPDCETATMITAQDGVYRLYIPYSGIKPFNALCYHNANGMGSWTIIQKRTSDKESFYQDWNSYKHGFGDPNENYWLGLEKIYALTSRKKYQLYIHLVDHEGTEKYARYSLFEIGDEAEKYYLRSVGVYSGDAGDSLGPANKTRRFTTFDADNDEDNTRNCANKYLGAWWFNSCNWSSLNGEYNNTHNGQGINWSTWRGYEYSLKTVYMAIRPIREMPRPRYTYSPSGGG